MKKWLCVICGWIYDEEKGWPEDGIVAGTPWDDVPTDWLCPDCGVGKEDFEMIEIEEDSSKLEPPCKELPVVIIGSGFAGYRLAEELRKSSDAIKITVLTKDDGASYSKPAISNALQKNKKPDALVIETAKEIEARLNIQVHCHGLVSGIDTAKQVIETDHGEYAYSKLVFATGAAPIKLPVKGNAQECVLSVNSLTDYRKLHKQLDNSKRVVIIGSGLIGCEFANDLVALGHRVTVIGLSNWAVDRLLPEVIATDLQNRLSTLGVQWIHNTTISAIDTSEDGYRLSLNNNDFINCDIVLSAIGLTPQVELAKGIGVEHEKGIIVDDALGTNIDNIYAIGDCIEIAGSLRPYLAPIALGVKALAKTLLGVRTSVGYPLMPIIIKTPALPIVAIMPDKTDKGRWEVENSPNGMRAFYFSEGAVLQGVVLSGKLTKEQLLWTSRIDANLSNSEN